jgi:hypothetical protein
MLAMIHRTLFVLFLAINFGFNWTLASELPFVHGTWIADTNDGCSEKMSFSPEGLIQVFSGQERLEGSYQFELEAGSSSIAKISRTITQSNRAPDCSGNVGNEVGKTRSAYAFKDAENKMRLCFDIQGSRCFGRFTKM